MNVFLPGFECAMENLRCIMLPVAYALILTGFVFQLRKQTEGTHGIVALTLKVILIVALISLSRKILQGVEEVFLSIADTIQLNYRDNPVTPQVL